MEEVFDIDNLPSEEVINKADKPLNKPFRLPKGSSKKFGVYVNSGGKTKKLLSVILTWKFVVMILRLEPTLEADTHVVRLKIKPQQDIGLAECGVVVQWEV